MKRKKKSKTIVYVPETDSSYTGTFAISDNGRFAEKMFLILGGSGDGFVLIADGKRRRLSYPKRKRLSHLTLVGSLEGVAESIRSGDITDGKVRKMINEIRRMRNDEKC